MKLHFTAVAALLTLASGARAVNICWVSDQLVVGTGASDNNASPNGTFSSGAGPYPDQGFVDLLTGAGHTVTRFNPADSANVLSAGDVATLNSFDLVILGRSLGSGSFDTAAEVLPWNTGVTKPLLATNAFLARRIRLGWFGGTGNGDSAGTFGSTLTFTNTADPVSSYLIGSATLVGSSTANPMYETITGFVNPERGQNFVTTANTPLPGANVIASGSLGYAIMSLPAGTVLGGSVSTGQTLGGYRLYFAAGNQEPATAPENVVGNAGFENLTPEMEQMFLRAVSLAANNGIVPVPEPATFTLAGLAGVALMRRRRA